MKRQTHSVLPTGDFNAPDSGPRSNREQRIHAQWLVGSAHDWVERSLTERHRFIYRFAYGRGQEATNSSKLQDKKWRAREISYFAPGSEYLHSTEYASDWIVFTMRRSAASDLFFHHDENRYEDRSGTAVHLSPNIETMFTQLRCAMMRGSSIPELLLEEICIDLISGFERAKLNRSAAKKRHRLNTPTLRRVTHFVEDNLADPLSVSQLASVSSCSPYHFAKAFRAETGQSPHQFVVGRRLAKSRELLKSRDVSLSQVALATGFGSQSHFQSSFKAHFGMTPGQFMQRS